MTIGHTEGFDGDATIDAGKGTRRGKQTSAASQSALLGEPGQRRDASHVETPRQTPARLPTVWLPIALLAIFWGYRVGVEWVELSSLARFLSRMAVHLIFLLGFFGWWFSRRQVPWRVRLMTPALALAGVFVAAQLADKSFTAGPLVMGGLPIVMTAWTVWFWLSRAWSSRAQLVGIAVLSSLVWAYFTLLRWDGFTGGQNNITSWRWRPSAEQVFLAEQASAKRPEPIAQSTFVNANDAKETIPAIVVQPGDWPEFRGPDRAARIQGLEMSSDWTAIPPQLLWRKRVGPGWSSMIVVDGRLYTQEQRGDNEAVVAYDAANGEQIWTHEDPVRFSETLSGAGPRGTPTFADGRLYCLGAQGLLNCLDATTGKSIWSRNIVVDASAAVPQWGFSGSPLVVEGLSLVFAGGEPDKGLLAYQASTGDLAWSIPAGKDSYSSAELAVVAGQTQAIMLSNKSCIAVEPSTGKVIWEHPMTNGITMPVTQPQLVKLSADSNCFLVQSGSGLSLFEVSHGAEWATKELWVSSGLKTSLSDFVIDQGAIYGFDDGIFCCLDLKTGKRLWKKGRYGHGQVLLGPEQHLLIVFSEQGEVILLAANPKKLEELGRFAAIEGKCWNMPTVAQGRLYVRNGEEIACYTLPIVAR